MKLFSCQSCGQVLYFENIRCEKCGHALGYLPGKATISAVEPEENGQWRSLADGRQRYRFCKNQKFGVCNWMIPARSKDAYCAACRHNRTIPDLNVPENLSHWARIETAKHRLFYTLLRLNLPLASREEDSGHGLAFDFLSDAPLPHGQSVMIGHDNGLITLAVKEADDAERERVRGEMGEPYRTLLGHFRHEVGHYFWDVLVRDGGYLDAFRALFGDERADYGAALQAHYGRAPAVDWQQNFVSTYASAHPWEDFAETWAHYLHIVDTLETAGAFGMKIRIKPGLRTKMSVAIDFDPHAETDTARLIDAWLPVTFAMNSLNRSMGHADLYPFVLAPQVIAKIDFVSKLVHKRV